MPVGKTFLVLVCGLQGIILCFCCARGGEAQTPSPVPMVGRLEFEVASIRQNKSDEEPRSSFSLDSSNVYSTVTKDDVFAPNGGYFSATNQPLWRYIVFAYKLSGTQELALRFNFFAGLLSHVPDWVNVERFDIKARFEGNPSKDQVRQMMQVLLADRFKLQVHHEIRQVPIFALVLVKVGMTGPNLQPHQANDACSSQAVADVAQGQPHPVTPAVGLPMVCGVIAHLPPSEPGRTSFGARDVDLGLLASSLPTQTGMLTVPRPVIDQTGLHGTFDFKMEWLQEFEARPDATGPTFREALRDQLGLKLESQKGPIDLVIIDHLEQPSAN
ncbi:hypothetical protein BH10ACI4_BH10ACI4_04870 [soil metagenome]